ncbi:hypothetical protein EV424DRAFT_881573 [Suillus variegatus]|nr:hypothetical protein EV424DRAFT_881573 [Suillus variegatus]
MNKISTLSLTPQPPPSQKSNKAAQAVLMEPAFTPFFVTVGSKTGSGSGSASINGSITGSGSGSASLFTPSIAGTSTSSSGSPPAQKKNKAAQAVLMEPNAAFFSAHNKSRVSLMGESSSSSSSSSQSVKESGKGRSRGSFGSRVTGLGLFGVRTSPSATVGSPSASSRVLEGESGEGTGHLDVQFPVSTPPDLRGAALELGSVVPLTPPLPPDSRSVGLLDVIPLDPRDHTVLETIYNEMHAERFINLSPLSLLANTVGLWFKDVRTHPPILLRFPPPREPESSNTLSVSSVGGSGVGADRNTYSKTTIISLDGLSNGASPYASLDCAISIQRQTQMRALPNPALDVDLKFLNLHLALRVKEIVACAEAMWEWVSEFQRDVGRTDGVYGKIIGLTRSQFDELLLRFELDMREHMGLGSVLEDRFNWSMISGPTPQEKRSFDTACEKWEAYRRLGGGSGDRTPCAVGVAAPHPATRLSRSLRVFVAWKPTA